MSTIAQWGFNLTTEAIQSTTSSNRSESIFDSFHYDLISFISIARFNHVDFLPNTWDQGCNSLGRGATGDVKQSVVNLKTSFAFKRFTNPHKEIMYRELISEVTLLMQTSIIEHPNIVDLNGITFELDDDTGDISPVLVFKRAQFGSIRTFMETGGGREIGFLHKIKICSEIGSAIVAMHTSDIIHGDIKPDNILIFGDTIDSATAQVTDFGYSCMGAKENDIVYLPVSRDWCAPEYHGRGIELHKAKKMDNYSFAMVCLWVLFGKEFMELRQDLERTNDRDQFHRSAMELASTAGHFGSELRTFFDLALREDWQEREDMEKLVVLLGQDIWEHNNNHAERSLTIADYGATPDDIKDPDKLNFLMRRILYSLNLTGSEYRVMEQHLDSSKFEAKHKTEWYVNRVLEGLSKFSVRSYQQHSDLRHGLAHNCFNVGEALSQLQVLDYRVMIYIKKCLEKRTMELGCEECRGQTAFQLAFCYTIGFGTPANPDKAQFWLQQSSLERRELDREISQLKRLQPIDLTIGILAGYTYEEVLNVSANDRYPNEERLMESKTYHERAIADLENCVGQDHLCTIRLRQELLAIAKMSKKWNEATAIASHLKCKWGGVLGPDHIFTLSITIDLAQLYIILHEWREAERLLLETKEPLERTLDRNHPLQLRMAAALASVYMGTRRTNEAAEVLSDATQRARRVYGHHSFAELTDMVNSGWRLMNQGDLETAEDMLFHAREGLERLEGPGHRGTLMATRNLALTYRKQGRISKAEEMQVDLKTATEHTYGLDHPETSNVIYDLARTYQLQRRWTEAVDMFVLVKEGREKDLGTNHQLTIQPSSRIAEIYTEQGRFDEAEGIVYQVRALTEQSLGPFNLDTLKAIRHLGITYWENGKLPQAEKTMLELIKRTDQALGPNHEETLGSMGNIGQLYRCQGKFEEAEKILRRTKEKMDAVLGPEHLYTKTVTNNLLNIFRDQGRFSEAFAVQFPNAQTTEFPVMNFPHLTQAPSPLEVDDEDDESLLNAALAMSLVPDSDIEEDELIRRAIELSLEDDSLAEHIE